MVAIEGELKQHQQAENKRDMIPVVQILEAANSDPADTYRKKKLLRTAVDGAFSVFERFYAAQAGDSEAGQVAYRSTMSRLRSTYTGIIQGLFQPSESGLERFIAKHSAADFIDSALVIQREHKFDLTIPRASVHKSVASRIEGIDYSLGDSPIGKRNGHVSKGEKTARPERQRIHTVEYRRPAPVSMEPNIEYTLPGTEIRKRKKSSNIAKNVTKLQRHLALSEMPVPPDFAEHWSEVNRYNKNRGVKVRRGPGRHNPDRIKKVRSREFANL